MTASGYVDHSVTLADPARAPRATAGADLVLRVLDGVSGAATVKGAIAATLQLVREYHGWTYAAYLRRDPVDGRLKCAMDSGRVDDEFREKTRSAQFTEGEALSGRAWRAGDLVFVEDFGAVTEFARAAVARRAGIRSAACVPLIVNGDIVGTLEFYADTERAFSRADGDLLRKVAHLVAAGIARVELSRFATMFRNSPVNTISADKDLRIQYVNPAAHACLGQLEEYLGRAADDLQGQPLVDLHPDLAAISDRLADPRRLPCEIRMSLGPEVLEVRVSPTLDVVGQFLGPMVTWEVITQRLEAERTIAEAMERERRQAGDLQTKVDLILGVVQRAAHGDLTTAAPVEGADAIGQLGEGVGLLVRQLREDMGRIGEHARTVAHASEELSTGNEAVTNSANETAGQVKAAARASEEVSRNVQTVAAGTQEMSVSIREIARNAADAARVAAHAVQVAERANATVEKLGASSGEIGKV
ncbi:MAG TPA: GAF domain-containing protein, partial [Gemmatimonadales bacterium]|nr:GAF domain-containing protein [Gemmatimonadales bacterium]